MLTCKKQLTAGMISLMLLAACAGTAPAAPIETSAPAADSSELPSGQFQFIEFYSPL